VQQPVSPALERNEALIDQWKHKPGRRSKNSSKRAPNDRLHRRKRPQPKASSAAHVGAARADARPPIPFQLENPVGHCRHHCPELLLQIFERAIHSEQIIEFLKHLLRYIDGDILLI
jgi:hypothetical protein